ncbi:oxidative stress-induced growth inhibitor 2 isoform X2 [Bemisia tabaci]|uniref:oxidative stress-induced growth inhibitor 2 isoform X2 n=1 Tax=Bemisia tabaci TaxID=7038 RepID=UPI003B2834AB
MIGPVRCSETRMREFANPAHCQCSTTDPAFKQVVIIGNGPSGIILSYLLNGNLPYYNGSPHPDAMLTARLQSAPSPSLIEQDLEFLSQGLEGRSNNPVSLLMDSLMHPSADLGLEYPSVVKFEHSPNSSIDHVVIGKGAPGGIWQDMKKNLLTISLSSWMDLPGLTFQEWSSKNLNVKEPVKRAKAGKVAQYFSDYVKKMKLCKYFKNHCTVTSVKRLKCSEVFSSCGQMVVSDEGLWLVSGFSNATHEPFRYITPRVVLATGTADVPNKLNVPGETLYSWIKHDLASFEFDLNRKSKGCYLETEGKATVDPVLVVGSGLSAADAILLLRRLNAPIIHVFNQSSTSVLKSLSKSIYPDYQQVWNLIHNSENEHDGYQKLPDHQILDFTSRNNHHYVQIASPDGKVLRKKISSAVILIGSRPNLSFLPDFFQEGKTLGVTSNEPIDCRKNPLNLNPWTHKVVNAPPVLYALGPLAGDNFVRFLLGGAVAVLCHIHDESKRQAVR